MLIMLSLFLTLSSAAMAVTVEKVTVGNPGNAADDEIMFTDSTTGYGSVGYTYEIGKYEVTNAQYCEFLNAVATVGDSHGLYNPKMASGAWNDIGGISRTSGSGTDANPWEYSVRANHDNRPVNWVSWGDAARFANWLTNGQPNGVQVLTTTEDGLYYLNGANTHAELMAVDRKSGFGYAIPTENEWYKGAYYNPAPNNYYDYPTSSDSLPGRDMTEATNLGNNANYYGSPFPIDSPDYTTVAGEFEFSDSPYGTFDQCGNLFEWTEGITTHHPEALYRAVRGGSLADYPLSYLRADYRGDNSPMDEGSVLGFRVASIPEPATLSLLVIGGLAMLIRRRRK